MKLQYKIMIFNCVLLIFVVGSISTFSYQRMKKTLDEQLGRQALNIAVTVASKEVVKENIGQNNGQTKIQDAVEELRLKTDVQFIVVIDLNGIRYSHPMVDRLGKTFVGEDEWRVLENGDTYISNSSGTLGKSLRAFAPVYRNGVQVGAVCVGILREHIDQEFMVMIFQYIPYVIIGLLIGIIGAWLLSKNIKKSIFDLEPEEIALLLSQKEIVLENLNEGIIAVDKEMRITLINQKAYEILGISKDKRIEDINKLPFADNIQNVLKKKRPIYLSEEIINSGMTVLSSYYLLKDPREDESGVVVSFRDLTLVKKLAEELTGIKKITEALRAQNHEFMNKLHAVSGLIQLNEYDKAVEFIENTVKIRKEVSGILTHRIKDAALAGMLLAKYNKASEAKIEFIIDSDSYICTHPENMSSDNLVSIIGNLIENAMDAVIGQKGAQIYVKVKQSVNDLCIEVKDNGPGIEPHVRETVFEKGVTTKSGERGYGLWIVKRIIDKVNGSIVLRLQNGTHWIIRIPMKGDEI